MTAQRDTLIIRVFADCGVRLDELPAAAATLFARAVRHTGASSASAAASAMCRFHRSCSAAWIG